jgi:hypothetical protein
MFLTATQSANIKAVLSSRPLSAFEASFANNPKLRLHDLTKHDIEIFVSDRLGQDPRTVELSQEDAAGVEALADEIVSAASGVFLWVKLAVVSLLEGFRNYDDFADLRQRLKTIPRDLEDFFTRILNQIPYEYKMQSSRMFQLVRCIETTPHPHRADSVLLTSRTMYFAEFSLDKILKSPIDRISDSEMTRLNTKIDGRLRSQCRGLLELHYPDRLELSESELTANEDFNRDPQVQYLHRSVADWLRKPHVWSTVVEGTKGIDYNPHALVVQALIMTLKSLPPSAKDKIRGNNILEPHWRLVDAIMAFDRASEKISGEAQEQILEEMDRVMSVYYEAGKEQIAAYYCINHDIGLESWCDPIPEDYKRPVPSRDTFLAFAIRHGLQDYVQAKIKSNSGLLPKKKGRPLLDYACRPEPTYAHWSDAINPAIVRCLLEHGADPNEKFDGCA